jgi:hypothetical protein
MPDEFAPKQLDLIADGLRIERSNIALRLALQVKLRATQAL